MVFSQLTLAFTRFSANQEQGGPFLAGSYPWTSLYTGFLVDYKKGTPEWKLYNIWLSGSVFNLYHKV